MREWYLFPDTLPSSLNPASYSNVSDYLDALTATARAQRKDRYFTYLTSIAEENAYNSSGATAGFGARLVLDGASRLIIGEAFENAPAANAGIQRGTQIVAIGTSTSNLRTVAAILAEGGGDALSNALGPDTVGTSRVLQLSGVGGDRTVTVAKANFTLQPVSPIYGAKVITDGAKKVGYINLRIFITTADAQLQTAFADFRAQGINEFIVDFRYNGGGLLSTANMMGNLLGGGRSTAEVFNYIAYRSEKSAQNSTTFFAPQAQSVTPTKIAFIGQGGTASASELVINGFIPYLHANVALIGGNTYGKPVGQIALDKPACDDRLRVVALALQNADRQGAYYDGLAGTVEASCRANDDFSRPMGDAQEVMTRQALDFLGGRSCIPISGASATASVARSVVIEKPSELLSASRPNPAQREVPGLF